MATLPYSRLLTIAGQPVKPQRMRNNVATVVSSFLINFGRLISCGLGLYERPDAAVYGFQAFLCSSLRGTNKVGCSGASEAGHRGVSRKLDTRYV